jgi:hypothetical protein
MLGCFRLCDVLEAVAKGCGVSSDSSSSDGSCTLILSASSGICGSFFASSLGLES